MWNNGQQQTAWWPNYTYSQFPVVATQDEPVDESQQWAIRAAMWAQQKKMQEHFQQQMQLYQEQAKQYTPKEDLPPLPPDGEIHQPPPPPEVEPRKSQLPHDVQQGILHKPHEPHEPREPPCRRSAIEDPCLQMPYKEHMDNRRPNSMSDEYDSVGGQREIEMHHQSLDARETEPPFRRGHWKPFGSSEDRDLENHYGDDNYHDSHGGNYNDFGRDRQEYHHSSKHSFDGNYEHVSHHRQDFYDRREPYQGDFHHQDEYPEEHSRHENHYHHRGPPLDMASHSVPEGDNCVAMNQPLIDQSQNMEYFSALPRLPPFAFPPPGEALPEAFQNINEDVIGLPGVESRRKGLPPWLREALEKLEKEKQKKEAKDKGLEDKGKSKMSLISGYQHEASSGESSDEADEKVSERKVSESSSKDEGLAVKPVDNRADTSPDTSDEEKVVEENPNPDGVVEVDTFQDLAAGLRLAEGDCGAFKMLRIKKMVTEVLLNVTNAEIKSIAFEVYNEAKRKALNTGNQLRSSGGLDALRNAMGSYGSSSDESDTEENNLTEKLSDRLPTSDSATIPALQDGTSSVSGQHEEEATQIKAERATSVNVTNKPVSSSDSSSSSSSSSESEGESETKSSSTVSSGHRKKHPKTSRHQGRERSSSSESESESSVKRKNKSKKREKAPSRKKNRRRSRSSSSEPRARRKRSKSDQRKDKKSHRRSRGSSEDRNSRKRHRERTPEKKSNRGKKKRKGRDDPSEDSSSGKGKRSSQKEDRKRKRKTRSSSRSRSRTPRRKRK